MIWSLLSDFWPVILAALTAVAGLGYRAKVTADARKDERTRLELEQVNARREAERKMAAAPRLGGDADFVQRLRDRGL